jgi:cholesterol oxidase
MNYLPDAYAHGAHIFTEVAVQSVGRYEGKWRVAFDVLGEGGERSPGAPSRFVTADVVVLAAGTLGSTQILLRSRDLGLPVSDRVGHGFSGNGDVLAFAYDTDRSVRDVGLGEDVPQTNTAVGPTITGLIDLRGPGQDLENALIIEDGAIPGALAAVIPLALCAAAEGVPEEVPMRLRELAGIPFGSHHGPVGRTGHEHRRRRRADRPGERPDPGGVARGRRAARLRA